jgi:hypothetical protein
MRVVTGGICENTLLLSRRARSGGADRRRAVPVAASLLSGRLKTGDVDSNQMKSSMLMKRRERTARYCLEWLAARRAIVGDLWH